MTDLAWSIALASGSLAGFALIGRRSRQLRLIGWSIELAVEPLWGLYGIHSGGLAFVVLAVAYGCVAVVNLRTVLRETTHGTVTNHTADDQPADYHPADSELG